jgi:hypothetical protein
VKVEERFQIRLGAWKKAAQVKSEDAGQKQENDNEDVSQGRVEIALQLAPEYGPGGCHQDASPLLP